KLSTSRNWAVWLNEYLERYPTKIDELRYTLSAIAPENKDSEFTWKEYQARVNNELGAILGNFVNRALVLTNKYYDGKVPAIGQTTAEDDVVLAEMKQFPERISKLIYAYKFREAQAEAMNLARLGNKYLADTEPWKLVKTDEKRVETIMHIALQITANLAMVLEPFLPTTAQKLRTCLNLDLTTWNEIGTVDLLKVGQVVTAPEILYPKIEDNMVEAELEILKNSQKVPVLETKKEVQPQKQATTFDQFSAMDIRLGTITAAEKVKKADKLLQLTVDTGIDTRTIISGIAEHYTPEEVIGKTVAVLLNLEPRKIKGIESQGMILMAEDENGKLSFMIPEKGFGAGSEIR
ncbi:MAG TPA: methionine--tRNA ligase subunit beta, partial [Crocinitomicaceae bacterium]|nr:methionine--tRNA ligase subunit beta [Crocinitomicaceae bacterium]